ncbi:MAG: uncharacterized protein A8A55_1551 [Amphiamblys sp. WSBS2006]|nr:MAG: uncharacterized protein A8A55_1551 [Amphiamblys sp. WSBS2006]
MKTILAGVLSCVGASVAISPDDVLYGPYGVMVVPKKLDYFSANRFCREHGKRILDITKKTIRPLADFLDEKKIADRLWIGSFDRERPLEGTEEFYVSYSDKEKKLVKGQDRKKELHGFICEIERETPKVAKTQTIGQYVLTETVVTERKTKTEASWVFAKTKETTETMEYSLKETVSYTETVSETETVTETVLDGDAAARQEAAQKPAGGMSREWSSDPFTDLLFSPDKKMFIVKGSIDKKNAEKTCKKHGGSLAVLDAETQKDISAFVATGTVRGRVFLASREWNGDVAVFRVADGQSTLEEAGDGALLPVLCQTSISE